jgi:hypothetical protein
MKKPATFTKKWSVEEKESILDYLHGTIRTEEVKACCCYEYARASGTLWRARQKYDPADAENSSLTVFCGFPGWIYGQSCFWQCANYPILPWRELTEEEQQPVLIDFQKTSPTPVIRDVLMLKGGGILDALLDYAKAELTEFNHRLKNPHAFIFPRQTRPAIVSDPVPLIKHVVITINYADDIDTVKEQIARWLCSEANEKLFSESHKRAIYKQNLNSPDRYKDLLKFLATWRLYNELGFEGAKEWTKENRRRKNYFAVPFFGEKLRKTPTGKHYTGPLFKEKRQWQAAIAKAEDFLATEIEIRQPENVG